MGQSYRDLIVWQKAGGLVAEVYRATKSFPSDERFGLVSQLRRAAVSVPSNIAEGQGRLSPGEFKQSLGIARGSLYELETQINLALDLEFLDPPTAIKLLESSTEVARLLNGLISHLRK